MYEAEDLLLRASVALKTLRPEIADDERALSRFRREILLARKVTHPHVCRIFDLFEHRPPFVTMELLSGESLGERLRATGPLAPSDALPVVTQLASALEAAHRMGIVHRDFKSANVMLVRAGSGQVRAVITDFGLARSSHPTEEDDIAATGSGGLVGTSAYMAPEQVENGEVGPAADIYALGIVMYEMLTGRRPFEAASPLATAVQRLTKPPLTPRHWIPDVDPRWERAILACLERRPELRPPHPQAIVDALTAVEVGPEDPPERWAAAGPKRSPRRLLRSWVACMVVLLGLQAILPPATTRTSDAAGLVPNAPPERQAVVMLGFRNLSQRSDTAWLSTALSETLGTELAFENSLRVVPGEEVARLRADLSLEEVDGLAKDTLARVRTRTGASFVVLGSYLGLGQEAGGRLRFDIRVQDARTGETVVSLTESGTEDRVLDLISRGGVRLRQGLASPTPGSETASPPSTELPATPEALRLYAEGMAKLRLLDALEARKLLEAAITADPSYFPARVALSEAWSALGYREKAREQAKQALRLGAGSSKERRLLVEGRYHEAGEDWARAEEAYQTLHALYPDEVDYGLRLAATRTAAGRPQEALQTLRDLRHRAVGSAKEDPRFDLQEAETRRVLSDFTGMRKAAAAAIVKGRAHGARHVLAKALVHEGRALRELGEPAQAWPLFEEARHIYERAGDRDNAAWTLGTIGLAHWHAGDAATAESLFREALDTFRSIGDQKGVAVVLAALAVTLRNQGKLREADRLQEQSLTAFREINDRQNVGRLLTIQGVLHQDRGELDRAAQLCREALDIAREAGNQRPVAMGLFHLGRILKDRGDLQGALRRFDESLALNHQISFKLGVAANHYEIGETLHLMGRLDEAEHEHRIALTLREELGARPLAAESRVAMAMLSLERGQPSEAVTLARAAAEDLRRSKAPSEALAHAALARALFEQGDAAEGRKAIRHAAAVGLKSEMLSVRLAVAILEARLRDGRRAADIKAALQDLERSALDARKTGLLGFELEARLALGELGIRLGQGTARGSLDGLEQEALRKGFGLIARKASATRLGGERPLR